MELLKMMKFRQPISLQELFLPTRRMNSEGMIIPREQESDLKRVKIILFSMQALFGISCNNMFFLEVNRILMVPLFLAFPLIRIYQSIKQLFF